MVKYKLKDGELVRFISKAERWKNIEEFPGYKISSKGRVKHRKELISIAPNYTVMLEKDGVRTRRSMQKLMMKYFPKKGVLDRNKVRALKRRIQEIEKREPALVARGTWNALAKEFGISRIMLWYIRKEIWWKGVRTERGRPKK
jgi:hypothetical protein